MVQLLVLLVVVSVVLYLINNYVPIASPIKTIISVVVLMVACIWLLRVGLLSFEHSHVVRSSEVNEDGMDQYPAMRPAPAESGTERPGPGPGAAPVNLSSPGHPPWRWRRAPSSP